MSSISRLESIYKDLEKEHRRIMKLMARLRAEASVSNLLPQLDGHERKEHQFAVDVLGARADAG